MPLSSAESLNHFLSRVWTRYRAESRYGGPARLGDFVYDLYKMSTVATDYLIGAEAYELARKTVQDWYAGQGGRLTSAGGYPALATFDDRGDLTSQFRIVVRPRPDHADMVIGYWAKLVAGDRNFKAAKVAETPEQAAGMGDPVVVYLVPGGACTGREALLERTKRAMTEFWAALQVAGGTDKLVGGLPPMVEEVLPGLGWAEQPPPNLARHRSFGEYRCDAIAAALDGATSEQQFFARTLEVFAAYRIDVRAPHLNIPAF